MSKSESKETENQPFLNYSDTLSIDDSEAGHEYPGRSTQSCRSRLFPYSIIVITTSLFWVFIFSTPYFSSKGSKINDISDSSHPHNVTSAAHLLTCGSDPATALASDCTYDILLNAWVPTPCYDLEFISEYLDDNSFFAFSDKELTQRIPDTESLGMIGTYYTSARDHVNHCAVMWKKQFFVLFEERKYMDSIITNPGHTDHCAQFLMDVGDEKGEWDWKKSTKVDVGYVGCWVRE